VVERMKELSAQYPRYGYRRIRIFLGRDGYRMSPGRAYRLWRAAGLQVPRRRPKKRLAAELADAAGEDWRSLDLDAQDAWYDRAKERLA
jgi:transposase InsO family protein